MTSWMQETLEAAVDAACGVRLNDGRALEQVMPADEVTRIVKAVLDAAIPRITEEAAKCVPMNWCDALLTGPESVMVPLDCSGVERLLHGVAKRIRSVQKDGEQ